MILRCRVTTNNAGPRSSRRGTNQSPSPIAGFEALLFDEAGLAAAHEAAEHRPHSSLSIWSGRSVAYYDFEFPTPHTDSSQVDRGVIPTYQFHLEVENVTFPSEGSYAGNPEMIWEPESFAVAESKESTRYEGIHGYRVSAPLEAAIMDCLTSTLQIRPEAAKVLPISAFDDARAGKRFSVHPLHDTFLGETAKQRSVELYRRALPGTLVADLDEPAHSANDQLLFEAEQEPLPRIQRVFTMPLDRLERLWAETARRLRSRE
jgi:hypothetical protein